MGRGLLLFFFAIISFEASAVDVQNSAEPASFPTCRAIVRYYRSGVAAADWNALGPVFNLGAFFDPELCYSSERNFLGCIYAMAGAIELFPGVPDFVPTITQIEPVVGGRVQEFFGGKVLRSQATYNWIESKHEMGFQLHRRELLLSWRAVFGAALLDNSRPVDFVGFVNWLQKNPTYQSRTGEFLATIANAKRAIRLDAYSLLSPTHVYEQISAPVPNGSFKPTYVKKEKVGPQPEIGIFQLDSFGPGFGKWSGRMAKQFIGEVADSLRAGMKSLILDLRGNPGGSVEQAVLVAQALVDAEKGAFGQTVHFNSKIPPMPLPRVRSSALFPDLPMVLLVDAGTTSAAEILAGILQDHRRAILIGERTFGKAVGQSSAILRKNPRVTATETVSIIEIGGRSFHGVGILPDVVATEWGVPAAEREPLRQEHMEMLPPEYSLLVQGVSKPGYLSKKFRTCLEARRQSGRVAVSDDPHIQLAIDSLACWESR